MSTETGQEAWTAEDHTRAAQRLAASADTRENTWDRSVDLQAAQVHATLAQTLTAAAMVRALGVLARECAADCGGTVHDEHCQPRGGKEDDRG